MNKLLLGLLFFFTCLNPLQAQERSDKLVFPQAHGQHPEAELEWWSFFGHLMDKDEQVFGFTLNFIRNTVTVQRPPSAWRTKAIYSSYFTLSDQASQSFYAQEKINRSSFNFAGASSTALALWNRNWLAVMNSNTLVLQAESPDAGLKLQLKPSKAPLLFGEQGFLTNLNLFYYALPNLQGSGELRLGEQKHQLVRIKASMEHAFQMQKNEDLTWDKFIIQLNNGDDIFLYLISANKGTYVSPASFCIINDAHDHSIVLSLADFEFKKLNSWYSEKTKITYPSGWTLTIPSAHYHLELTPVIKDQEISTSGESYWQGQSRVSGEKDKQAVEGYAYVQLPQQASRNFIL